MGAGSSTNRGDRFRQSIDPDDEAAVGDALLGFQPERDKIPHVVVHKSRSNDIAPNDVTINISGETGIQNATKSSNSVQFRKLLSFGALERESHSAVAVKGVIYSFGGMGDNNHNRIDIHVLNTTLKSQMQWKPLRLKCSWWRIWRFICSFFGFKTSSGFIPSQRYGHTVVAVKHLIYLWGGWQCNNQLHLFNTKTGEWKNFKVEGELPPTRCWHSASIVRNKMYVFGGWDYGTDSYSNSIKCLDLSTLSWLSISPKNDPPPPRECHSATVHGDRFILIFGGRENEGLCNSLVCFDAETNEWIFPKVTGTIPDPRKNHCAFNVNGFMYVFGGWRNSGRSKDLFRYNIENFKWEKVIAEGEIPHSSEYSQSVVIKDQVFICGGRKNISHSDICDETFVLAID